MPHIYNSLTKTKAIFNSHVPKKINMYVCGMTVYDLCHIGHARVMTVFDMITRYFRYLDYDVNYIRNITDIDDKIIARAHENQEPYQTLTARFIEEMHKDTDALNILPPTKEPRATEYIAHMISLIQQLVEKKLAYVASNGDVYYAVHQFKHYGELAHQDVDKLRSGARVSIVEAKTDPLDFALWKLAKPDEPAWDSPWGKGRPGWHIECSAMALDCLEAPIDIHGGGFDLIFPHHQNEIAQSEGATDKKFVNTWMHVGFVTINKEKMSKSLNNFFTIREVLNQYPPEVVRYYLLSSHYRSPLNYSVELLDQSRSALERLYLTLRDVPPQGERQENAFSQRFHEAMEDDFNTPIAFAVLFDLAREINKTQDVALSALLKHLAGLLGFLTQDPDAFLKQALALNGEEIEALIVKRNAARQAKDWALADDVRKQLQEKGITIEDGAKGTTWRRS
jgi:cysteinyl-tRNA synthetase